MIINPMLLTDFYKISHHVMSEKNTEFIYSTFTPRQSMTYSSILIKILS